MWRWRDAAPFCCRCHEIELRLNRSSARPARNGALSSIRRLIVGLLQTSKTRAAGFRVPKNLDGVFIFISPTSSSPVPEITWKRANGVPFPSKVKMKYSNAVLEIPSFQQDDTGGYECVAENRMGKNTATGRLAFYGTQTLISCRLSNSRCVSVPRLDNTTAQFQNSRSSS